MKKNIILAGIIIAAFVVRIIGIRFGLPFLYHDDEPIVVNYALAYGTGNFNPHVFNIAPFLTYCLFFLYGIFFTIGRMFGLFHNIKDFAYLYLNDPTAFYIIGRCALGIFCGTASVPAIYFIGKKYFNQTVGLLAAFFLALNFLHVRDSHYIYFDIPLTLCVLLFFLKAYDLFSPGRKKDYIELGALFGLAMSVKFQGVFLAVPFFLIIIYNLYVSKKATLPEKASNLIWCGASLLAVMFIANPFLFLNLPEFLNRVGGFPYAPVPPLHHLTMSLFNGCGMFMALFGVMGIAWAAISRKQSALLSAYAVLYYLIIIKVTQSGERLVLPIVPLVLLFAASVVVSVAGFIKNKKLSVFTIILCAVFLTYPSLARICYSDILFLREDTRTQAYSWVKDNISPNARIALDATASWFPRLEKSKEQIAESKSHFGSSSFGKPENAEETKLKFMLENPYYPEKTYRLVYLRGFTGRGFLSIYPCINVKYDEMESKDVDYAVLSNIITDERYADFVREIEKHAVVLKTFSPYKDGISRVRSAEVAPVPAAAFMYEELRDRNSYGPYIRIYKIKR
jgi:hypothetical protein